MTKRGIFDVIGYKADHEGPGTFEALVAVYGNVDLQGDRILPGAFDKSIGRWQESGDPIPAVWSHNWGDPHAYFGTIDPANVRSTDEGLVVRGHVDDDPTARKIHELLKSRRVRQWSFAYEVRDEKRGQDGANNLIELDLIEAGATLKGANPMTDTLAAKGVEPVTPGEIAAVARLHAGEMIVGGPVITTLNTTGTITLTNGESDDEGHAKGGRGPASDSSTWDAGAAMASAKTAADYRAICAGERSAGEPDERQHWALPHHKAPGSPANAAGVRAARARLGQTEGLTNAEAARRHLFEAHKLPSETAASADPGAVKAEAIARLIDLRDWATEQLKALDPEIDPAESDTVSLDAQIEKLRHEVVG